MYRKIYEARIKGFGIVGIGRSKNDAIWDLRKWVDFAGLIKWDNNYILKSS